MFESIKNKVLNASGLKNIREKNRDQVMVFCSGCYDIIQTGHAVFFNQCKSYGDMLVVGVGRDETIRALKGPGRPVNPETNRLYLVAALEDVDYVVLNDDYIGEGKIDFKSVLEHLKPDIFILNDDDSGQEPKKALCEQLGIKVQMVSRETLPELEATSTTRIIDKIVFAYKAPLRIDFAGGWTDIPYIMEGHKGYVSNMAIRPNIEYKEGKFNFSGYPRGSGLSTSTAVEILKMISAKTYNADTRTLSDIAEDLFHLENKELNWAIGRQDQYSIVFGGYHCFEFGKDYGKDITPTIPEETLKEFVSNLLLLHTGISRSAQSTVEEVYNNFKEPTGKQALQELASYGQSFTEQLIRGNFKACADIMNKNFAAQKKLAPSSSNEGLEAIYLFAIKNGALGGKICGAGGGGAFIFYCNDKQNLINKIKKNFTDCFEIDFQIEENNIKELNKI